MTAPFFKICRIPIFLSIFRISSSQEPGRSGRNMPDIPVQALFRTLDKPGIHIPPHKQSSP